VLDRAFTAQQIRYQALASFLDTGTSRPPARSAGAGIG
jgi:hypothetical protein